MGRIWVAFKRNDCRFRAEMEIPAYSANSEDENVLLRALNLHRIEWETAEWLIQVLCNSQKSDGALKSESTVLSDTPIKQLHYVGLFVGLFATLIHSEKSLFAAARWTWRILNRRRRLRIPFTAKPLHFHEVIFHPPESKERPIQTDSEAPGASDSYNSVL